MNEHIGTICKQDGKPMFKDDVLVIYIDKTFYGLSNDHCGTPQVTVCSDEE